MNARRLLLLPSMVVAIGAGVASASVIIPAPAAPVTDAINPAVQPSTATPTVAAQTPDPSGGGLDWGVRVYRSQTGQTCPTPGRLSLGRFGRFGNDGTFQELPLAAAGSCADLTKGGAALAVERFPAQGLRPARTVIYGSTANAAEQIVLHDATGAHPVPVDRGAFMVVRADSDLSRVSVDVVTPGSPTQSVALAASSTDPG